MWKHGLSICFGMIGKLLYVAAGMPVITGKIGDRDGLRIRKTKDTV